MNHYEARQAARRERLEARAEKASADSNATFRRARTMGEAIPFGQPILVGHHSEGRDRRYRGRIHDTYGKAVALSDKANHYAGRAAAVGTGGISSDDPDAVAKLRKDLEERKATQERMVAANKAIRRNKTAESQRAALVTLGYTEEQAAALLQPDFAKRIGFPSYALQNNNASIRRIEARIKELEANAQRQDKEHAGKGYTYREDAAENRVMFLFAGKPDAETRALLKRHAFNWSPSREGKPWVRKITNAALYAAAEVRKILDARDESHE